MGPRPCHCLSSMGGADVRSSCSSSSLSEGSPVVAGTCSTWPLAAESGKSSFRSMLWESTPLPSRYSLLFFVQRPSPLYTDL